MIKKIPNSKFKIINFGFTLIELLVVISIIGILASLLLARFSSAEKSGRDTRRKSDLNQYRTALENYAVKTNGLYPSYTGTIDASVSLCSALGATYIASCPQDPRQDGSTYYYRYLSNGAGSPNINATQYILWAKMERETNLYWYVCANGKAAEKTAQPATSDCGF